MGRTMAYRLTLDTLVIGSLAFCLLTLATAGVLLREVINEEPDSAEPRYLLGVLREVEGKPRAAAEAYRDALRVDPHYEPAKLHLMKYQDAL
jgi:cytochrome c-type biogenesis protein CcmH/NrfG